MVIVRGRVNPHQADLVPGQAESNQGIWNMSYELIHDGKLLSSRQFTASPDGQYKVRFNAKPNSTVRVACYGGWGYETVETCTHIEDGEETVYCPLINMVERETPLPH